MGTKTVWGIILASGWGMRLRSWGTIPKPLTPIKGRPLIEYPAKTLRAVGVDSVVVVERPGTNVHEAIEPLFERVVTIINYRVWLGNAYSLSLALKAIPANEFVTVIMSDHVIEPTILRKVLGTARKKRHHSLGVDARPKWVDVDEATKVVVSGGRVVRAGKELAKWDAVDVGAATVINYEDLTRRAEIAALEGMGFSQFMAGVSAVAADVSGRAWFDIDSLEEVAEASIGRLREVIELWERETG